MARVLFIDDDPMTLETLGKAVEVFGHQSIWATNGQEALQTAREQDLDIIFLDISLPDIDGLTLIGKLRQIPSLASTPLLVLSASPELDAAELAYNAGAQAYLTKPIRLQTLLDMIQQHTSA
ncbi:MAG: response regulator [Anaerolineales bacterium]